MNSRDLSRFSKRKFDLLVVGGGINGAAIANVAAAAGASVAIVDKGDWASGTSSKSTKLLHGGIRYLENLEFDLVAEALKERYIQWKAAPHLVRPLRFIVPVYQHHGRPLWMMKLGVSLYDFLSGKYGFGSHETLPVSTVMQTVPGIQKSGLLGAVSYFDAQMDDARLCLENVLMAQMRGAVAANYVQVTDFLKNNGRSVGAKLYDNISGDGCEVRADQIVVAAGPWADFMRYRDMPKARGRLRTTKGVHLVTRGPLGQDAFLLQNKKDNRVFFIIPFHGNSLIGTTDTDFDHSPDDVRVEQRDVDYLLGQAREFFPGHDFSQIIASFTGLRPLVHESGSPSKISRKHVIEQNYSGVWYVMGGKYTTYRAIALDCLSKVLPQGRCSDSDQYQVYGSGLPHVDVRAEAVQSGVDPATVSHLISKYGSRFKDVLQLCLENPALKGKICTCTPTIRAQVAYAVQAEMAMSADDIYARRLQLEFEGCPTGQCRKVIEDQLKGKEPYAG